MAGAVKQRKSTKAVVEEDVYIIDKIMEYREEADGPKWRIRWKNYTAADDTWEPAENIMAEDKKLQADMARLQAEHREERRSAKNPSPARRPAKSRDSSVVRSARAEVRAKSPAPLRGKRAAASPARAPATRVAHIRRYPDRDDDFQCVLTNGEGESRSLPVSEARREYYNELIDYLLKRVKFLEAAS